MDMTAMRAATLLLLPLLLCASAVEAAVKEYYIAALEIGWDYVYLDNVDQASDQRSKDIPQKYVKAVYRQYTDSTYTVPKTRPAWTGIQGPVIVTRGGDRVVIHFKNLASQSYSISPVGITYWKQSEGAGYDDSTAGQEKDDDAVSPGGYYKYVWDISNKDVPTTSDPECLTYSYSSQVDTVRDVNSGLIGALLICKTSALTDDGQRINPAFVLMFAVFDETKSWYGEVGERKSREKFKRSMVRKEYHTINGYVNSTLPGLTMCQDRNHVFWHMIGMGTAPEIHSIQFQDHTLQVLTQRKVTMEVTPMTFITAEMKPATIGRFLMSCQIHAHHNDGMNAFFTVEDCPAPVTLPGPDLRNVKHIEGTDDYSDTDLFNTIQFQPKKPQVHARASGGQLSMTWQHYIAVEEVVWDYAPHLKPTDSELQSGYLPAAPHHLGYKYKKAVFVEYTDGSFTQRKNIGKTMLGPLLKGKINDQIHITLRNLASWPFNIYPNGLTRIFPLPRYANAAEKDLRSMGVPPNGTFGYVWKLTTDDGPLAGDPQCLTQLYQSTVSPERDLASGLVGTLLICKSDAIDTRGRLLGSDKDWSLMFAVFDENRSWYINENMQKSSLNSYNSTDPEFYNSNVIYNINGVMFAGRQFVVSQTDVAFWHVANVGSQSDFLSIYFTGNLFQYKGLYQSVLTLFPMTGMTVPMETELMGEWEISAYDGSLKSRGMSIRYSVRHSVDGDRVDRDEIEEDIFDYIDPIDLQPRGRRTENRTVLVRVCKKPLANNNTQWENTSSQNVTNNTTECHLKKVIVSSLGGENPGRVSEGGIPQDILEEIERDGEWTVSQNGTEAGGGGRQRRQAEGNSTDVDNISGASEERGTTIEIREEAAENRTEAVGEVKDEERSERSSVTNATKGELEESNEILLNSNPQLSEKISTVTELSHSKEIHQNLIGQNNIQSEPERLTADVLDLNYNYTAYNSNRINLDLQYEDYNQEMNGTSDMFAADYMDLRSGESRYRHYYIAAEEITWNYGIRKPLQAIEPREMRRGMRKFLPEYKKVVFRAYSDKDFRVPVGRGESQEHLGIMGPFIRAEINDLLTVVFKNKASRPYSFHLQGVYDRSQGAGLGQTHASSAPPGVPGEPVAPGEAKTYNWRITRKQGPTNTEFDCKTGAYYSTVDKEKDLNSGLIGPLVICKSGTLRNSQNTRRGVKEFALLFHTFDETKSWYLEESLQRYCAPPCQANTEDPWYHINNKFAAINGYVAETLPGLLIAQRELVRWHLLNVGSDREYHAVHFHGLPFTVHTKNEHRMGVYNLFPGVFGTVEMRPPRVGTWLVECTVGDYQLAGMRAKLLVYDPKCILPLGMKSRRIEDSQITASDHIGNWEPRLARLEQSGYINAWIGKNKMSWIQVDLQTPTLLHGVQTQGVSLRLRDNYITFFKISYSLDGETWTAYRGNTTKQNGVFYGNMKSSKVKNNQFSPPFVARYVRIQPENFVLAPALRLELLGCDLNSCSLPLGLQKRLINDTSFSASSFYSSLLRSWTPELARLHQEGSANAWRPKNNNPHEWLQVDFAKVRRITGVVMQGARSVWTQMIVTEFSVTVSLDRISWSSVLEENSQREKIFTGNNDSDDEALTVFDPPLFGRYLRIHPRGWINDIALRLEVLGCDTQQGL
ncbi:LOW QUALITY PROTEIN: coagulation factor VIII [Cottoperca gobio]|uniref:LOW QUALITY PROTEIN: coagulation factor VIII n=1 Tax=Cottoperca gobio TaxID=56716 RepID=A0A6J2QI81_COTGO|nr:LOW QUALITY PROTEIN: coagulation factor VIII-like [Cottoperca gobio]